MNPIEVTTILRKFARACRADEYLWGTSLPGVPTEVGADALHAALQHEVDGVSTQHRKKSQRRLTQLSR